MRGVFRLRDWSLRAALAAALVIWALGGPLGVASLPSGTNGGFSQTSMCAPSNDGRDAPPASRRHHCLSCVLCGFHDLADSIVVASDSSFDFAPQGSALAHWPRLGVVARHRRDLIAQRPRAPPFFS